MNYWLIREIQRDSTGDCNVLGRLFFIIFLNNCISIPSWPSYFCLFLIVLSNSALLVQRESHKKNDKNVKEVRGLTKGLENWTHCCPIIPTSLCWLFVVESVILYSISVCNRCIIPCDYLCYVLIIDFCVGLSKVLFILNSDCCWVHIIIGCWSFWCEVSQFSILL